MPPKEDSNPEIPFVALDSRNDRTVVESSPSMKRLQLSDVAMAKSEMIRPNQATVEKKNKLQQQQQQQQRQQQSNDQDQDPVLDHRQLWWIHGRGYDLEDFVRRHPGGKEAILLGKGRDCTALVESYHAFSSHHGTILEKYRSKVTSTSNSSAASASSTASTSSSQQPPEPDIFYDILKQRVAAVLRQKGIDPIHDRGAGPLRMMYYVIVVIAVLVTGYLHVKGSVGGSFAFAIFGWLVGSLGHDAGHFAVSHRYPQLNEWGVWAMSLICNPVMWQQQHTYGHHSFTNEISHDPDVHHFERMLRVHRGVPYDPKYEKQRSWLWVAFAYTFVVFGTAFYIPITMIQSGTLYGVVDWHDKDRPSKAIGMRLHNLCYFLIVMVAPFFSHQSAWVALGAVTLHISTLGILFGVFSQINHLNELSLEADMETRQSDKYRSRIPRDPRLESSWAAAQVETSNNFASQSLLWHFLSNGLNHQIEHHLFPALNHAHLHHIAPIVRETCDEFGVRYKSFDSWTEIMTATLRWYQQLSLPVDDVPTGTFKDD